MNFYELIILIVLLFVFSGVVKNYFESRAKETEQQGVANDSKSAELEQSIARLESRIRVLEEIITSDGYDLKRKFEDLER